MEQIDSEVQLHDIPEGKEEAPKLHLVCLPGSKRLTQYIFLDYLNLVCSLTIAKLQVV